MHIQTSDQERFKLGLGEYSCNWGMHMAGLYETEAERDEIVFGFLQQGDIDGDLQVYCPVERTAEDFQQKFSHKCPSCRDHLGDPDRFQLLSVKDIYYPDGIFSPSAMDKGLNALYEASQKNGRRNIRAAAEMVWALEAIPGTEHLMIYESRLNLFHAGKPWTSICLYNLNKFSGATIMDVLRTHPYTISGGVISQNPYFVEPEKWLSDNAPAFLSLATI